MKALCNIVVAIYMCFILYTFSYANIIQVDSVSLHGLKYITKQEILRYGIFTKEGKIYVNEKALHNGLKNHPIIESFTVNIKNNACIIHVKEKNILAIVLFNTGNSFVSVEVDSNLSVLSTSRVYAFDKPIIKITKADVVNNQLSPRIMNILIMLKKLMFNNSDIVSRIAIIDCSDTEVSYVHCVGFASPFMWDETYEALSLLDNVIGLYDNKKAYPDNAVLTQKRIVVW